jgi:hypothetical protein
MDTYGRPVRAERGEADGGTRSEVKELRHLRRKSRNSEWSVNV